jgi:DNA-binding transcriptional LysR family regulator
MRHLQSFNYVKVIAESGSIRGAAESLTISPSALNRHIQTLELDLGFQIFDRLTKGVRLSTEGELFYQYALRQISSFQQLCSQIEDIKGLRTGVVRIGVSADLGLAFLHSQIAEYQNDHPEVSFELKTVTQHSLETELDSNQIDMALFYQPVLSRNLQVVHAFETPAFAVLPNGAQIRNRNGLMLYELIDQSVILPPHDTQLRAKVDAACEKLGITLRTKMECSDPLPHLSTSNQSRVAFCVPFPQDFDEFAIRGYKLVPIASKEMTTGFVNLVTRSQSFMAIAPQRFAEKLIGNLEIQQN